MNDYTTTIQRTKRIGGSLMVRIPKDIVELEHIHAGESIELGIKKMRKDWFGVTPGLKPFRREEDRMQSKYE